MCSCGNVDGCIGFEEGCSCVCHHMGRECRNEIDNLRVENRQLRQRSSPADFCECPSWCNYHVRTNWEALQKYKSALENIDSMFRSDRGVTLSEALGIVKKALHGS